MAYPTPEAHLKASLDAGLAAHQQGDIDQALAAYRTVLALAPDHPDALRLLGTALLQAGEPREAVSYLERAVGPRSADPHLLANLGQAYLVLKRYTDAARSFRKASRLAPNEVQLQVGMAAALAMDGRLGEAEATLTRQAARFPNVPLVWFNLGNVLRDTRRHEPAIAAYRKALELDPQMVDARNSLGSVLHSLLRFAEAEKEYRACIEIAPEFLLPRYNLASVTMDLGRFDDAIAASRDVVALAPDTADAHRLLGAALGLKSRLLDALPCYERAAALAPDDVQSVQSCGGALMEAGRPAEGLRWLAHAARLAPDSVSRRQITGTALLAHGHLAEGWIDYVDRPSAIELRATTGEPEFAQALPATLADRHVCLCAEQGLGDHVFFLRYAPLLAARGARVSYGPTGKLHSLLARVPSLTTVFSDAARRPHADAYVLVGDLPRMLEAWSASALPGVYSPMRGSIAEFERHTGVFWPRPAPTLSIAPLPERLAQMRERLATFGPPPYIGLTWHGGTAPEKQNSASWVLFKTIGVTALARVLENVRGTLIAVQRKPAPGALDTLSAALARPVHDLTALNDDLEGMLAALALLDDYVGVSNTNMHLRAAAGRTARVLVPAPAEWRWMQSGAVSPWFPGFDIYRQSLQGDWSAAFAALERDLQAKHGTL